MGLRDDLERCERENERLREKLDAQAEERAEMQYELNRYRTALAGVRWLIVQSENVYQKQGFNP